MPISVLSEKFIFPDPQKANSDGLVAVGGDLQPLRLLQGYAKGIFPWYDDHFCILWWSPEPRCVLDPYDFHLTRRLKRIWKQKRFSISVDNDFSKVIANCASIYRKGQQGTWITPEMQQAYINLHKLGYAHSLEIKVCNQLVGGLYGVYQQHCFFAESMYHLVPNASSLALLATIQLARLLGIKLIDCQMSNKHLQNFGVKNIARSEFIGYLQNNFTQASLIGDWSRFEQQLNAQNINF